MENYRIENLKRYTSNRVLTVSNHTPVLSIEQRQFIKQTIERQLFEVFIKYRK